MGIENTKQALKRLEPTRFFDMTTRTMKIKPISYRKVKTGWLEYYARRLLEMPDKSDGRKIYGQSTYQKNL